MNLCRITVESLVFNRVVNTWNSLPNWVVSANTTVFKARVDKFWHNQDIVFQGTVARNRSRSECLCL